MNPFTPNPLGLSVKEPRVNTPCWVRGSTRGVVTPTRKGDLRVNRVQHTHLVGVALEAVRPLCEHGRCACHEDARRLESRGGARVGGGARLRAGGEQGRRLPVPPRFGGGGVFCAGWVRIRAESTVSGGGGGNPSSSSSSGGGSSSSSTRSSVPAPCPAPARHLEPPREGRP